MAGQAIRNGDTISNIINSHTGEYETYTKATGSNLNADGVIYRQLNGPTGNEIFKLNIDGTINARRFGVIGDQITNDTVAFQFAIDICILYGLTLDIRNLKLKLTDTIYIDGKLALIGDVRNTVLDFTALPATFNAIVISKTKYINGVIFDGIQMLGASTSGAALRFNLVGNNPAIAVTDSSFKNMRVEGFGIGMKGSYAFCNLFENIRFQGCVKPLELGSQFNNTEFIRCSLVSFSATNTFTNCEGINLTSCNLANSTALSVLNLFQSNISLINPYIEHIKGNFATVGSSNQVVPSSFTMIGGKSTDATVLIQQGGDRCPIIVKNLSPNARTVVYDGTSNLSPSKYTTVLEVDSMDVKANNFLTSWDAQSDSPFKGAFGGSINTRILSGMGTSILRNDSASSNGILLSNSLVVGQPYILVYRIRQTAATDAVIIRHGTIASSFLKINALGEEFEERYLPFVAKDVNLSLIWDPGMSIEFEGVGLTKSNYPSQILKGGITKFNAPPTIGTYRRGDILFQSNPSGGPISGWECAAAGTPGTWRPIGQVGEDSGITAARPTVTKIGYQYFDTTLNKLTIWNGSTWIDVPQTNIIDLTTTPYTKATLNAAYPNVKKGTLVVQDAANFSYIKRDNATNGGWSKFSTTQLT